MKFFFACFAILFLGHSQICGEANHKAPEIKLNIRTEKEIYRMHDRASVSVELTDLTNQTLCFPNPALDCEVTGTGSLIVGASLIEEGEEREQFICHADSVGPNRDELLSDIDHKWIKLAPNAVYTTKSAIQYFKATGRWRIHARYSPPVGSFDPNYVEFLQSAADTFECRVPKTRAAAAAEVTVVSASDGTN